MNTPTQSNTIPAIRALLWERWLIASRAFAVAWVVYLVAALGLSLGLDPATGMFFESPGMGGVRALLFGGAMLAGLTGVFEFSREAKKSWAGLPPHQARLPISNTALGLVHFWATLFAVAVLFAGAFAIDFAVLKQEAILAGVPVENMWQPVGTGLIYTAVIHTALLLRRPGKSGTSLVIMGCIVVTLMPGTMFRVEASREELLAQPIVLLACAALSVSFTARARTRTARPRMDLAAWRPRRSIRFLRGPFHALLWHELRSWGRSYALMLAVLLLAGWGLHFARGEGEAASDWLIRAWLAAWAIGGIAVYLGERRLPPFQALLPVRTWQLALARVLAMGVVHVPVGMAIFAAGAFVIAREDAPGEIAQFAQQFPLDLLILAISLLLMGWIATGGYYFVFLIAFVTIVSVYTMTSVGTPGTEGSVVYTAYAVPVLIVAAYTIEAWRRRVLPWYAIAGAILVIGAVSLIFAQASARLMGPSSRAAFGDPFLQVFALSLFLVLFYPIVKRLRRYDQWRTNLPPSM